MFIESETAQRDLLTALVERRLNELAELDIEPVPEEWGQEATAERELLEQTLQQLHETEFDVTA